MIRSRNSYNLSTGEVTRAHYTDTAIAGEDTLVGGSRGMTMRDVPGVRVRVLDLPSTPEAQPPGTVIKELPLTAALVALRQAMNNPEGAQ